MTSDQRLAPDCGSSRPSSVWCVYYCKTLFLSAVGGATASSGHLSAIVVLWMFVSRRDLQDLPFTVADRIFSVLRS